MFPLLTCALTLFAIFLFWSLSSTSSSPFARNFPQIRNKRICLLIAHPDDEAMFFSPTVLALTKPELGNHLKILCLSSGNADGLGHLRKKELQLSAKHLGLRNESDVFIMDDPSRFPDSMTTSWSESDVASVLASAFLPPTDARKKATAAAATASIDVLLTFDRHGVSNHPNHRSLYHGAVHFLRALMKDKPGYACPVALYTLTTTNILRKYIGVLDAPFTMVTGALASLVSSRADGPGKLLFVSSVDEYIKAQAAMVKAHKSQMVWFRYGWITLGRYMVVNDLKREKI